LDCWAVPGSIAALRIMARGQRAELEEDRGDCPKYDALQCSKPFLAISYAMACRNEKGFRKVIQLEPE